MSEIGDSRPDETDGDRRRAVEVAARRRLLECEPGKLRDLDAAAECFCSCHPQPADPDVHRGGSCPCQLTPEERSTAWTESLKLLDERTDYIEARMRARESDAQIAAIAAEFGIEATLGNPFAPWVIVGRVDGRSFYLRERWGDYTLEVAGDDHPSATSWTTEDPASRITVSSGDATDLGPASSPPDYREALTLITATIRQFLRRRACDHPHRNAADWFCSRCGECLVDLAHPPAEPTPAERDGEGRRS